MNIGIYEAGTVDRFLNMRWGWGGGGSKAGKCKAEELLLVKILFEEVCFKTCYDLYETCI